MFWFLTKPEAAEKAKRTIQTYKFFGLFLIFVFVVSVFGMMSFSGKKETGNGNEEVKGRETSLQNTKDATISATVIVSPMKGVLLVKKLSPTPTIQKMVDNEPPDTYISPLINSTVRLGGGSSPTMVLSDDHEAPVMTQMTGPPNGGTVNFTTFCFPQHWIDNTTYGIEVHVAFDSDSFGNWGFGFDQIGACYNNVSNGVHTFKTQGRDKAGNMSGVYSSTFTVNTEQYKVPSSTPVPTSTPVVSQT